MTNSLRSSEWILVGSLLLILASLLVIAKVNASRCSSLLGMETLPSHELIPIAITGAVKKPGTYEVLPGTPIKKVLFRSSPTRYADLKKLDLELRVEEPLAIHVEALTEVRVHLEGAVPNPLEINVPVGTRVCDLRSNILLNPDAEKAFFKSRRILKDGEILEVPKKGG